MQKRRIWEVAIAHFALTAFFGFRLLNLYGPISGVSEQLERAEAFRVSTENVFSVLQPQFWILSNIGKVGADNLFSIVPSSLRVVFAILSVPAWSFCFGWLYVKFTNWLNHFPVLGKRVF